MMEYALKPEDGLTPSILGKPLVDASTDSIALLNSQLRQQLSLQNMPVLPVEELSVENTSALNITQSAVVAVTAMLAEHPDKAEVAQALMGLFDALMREYLNADIELTDRKRQYIAVNGLVMSPDHCVTTQTDADRVQAFIRGINSALNQLTDAQPFGFIRVVYPACGPFAPLLLPLLTYYSVNNPAIAEKLKVVLIDIQPGAVKSLEAVIKALRVDACIDAILCMDACDYISEQKIDLLVVESMQHGFSREGHLPLVRNLVPQMASTGIMIPKRVELSAQLAAAQYEYIERWHSNANSKTPLPAARIRLGNILTLTLESARQLTTLSLGGDSSLVPCNRIRVPELAKELGPQILLICTRIETYAGEQIDEYQSGITHPLPDTQVCINFIPKDPKPGDLLLTSGDNLQFFYRLNGLPGFLAAKAEDAF